MDEERVKEWMNIFWDEFDKESDRACVILSAAMLDTALETVLRAHLVVESSATDRLFDGPNAPISDFSAKIDLAYRLGLISSMLCHDLHLIRRIRNDFAHNIAGCSFNDSSVRDRVAELVRSSKPVVSNPKMRRLEGARGDFEIIVSWMIWHLNRQPQVVKRLSTRDLEWGYIPVKSEASETKTQE